MIYGAGGHARELAFQITADGSSVSCFVDDIDPDRKVGMADVLTFADALDRFSDHEWIVGIGSPSTRRLIYEKLRLQGLACGSYISGNATICEDTSIGDGAQIFSGACISTGCTVGDGVIVHFGAILCHDVKAEPFAFIGPRAVVSGHVHIGAECWIGVGATVLNGSFAQPLRIGQGAIVGAGAVVTTDVEDGVTVVGVPARVCRRGA